MTLLVDMSLSPLWVDYLTRNGMKALHWSGVGDPGAKDEVIMEWARENGSIIFTNDLDFGTILAHTSAKGPSVIQLRSEGLLPSDVGDVLLSLLKKFESALNEGSIIVYDKRRSRVRLLPIKSR
jgi:predicted nuclease of predicted toxin-antitoxin system